MVKEFLMQMAVILIVSLITEVIGRKFIRPIVEVKDDDTQLFVWVIAAVMSASSVFFVFNIAEIDNLMLRSVVDGVLFGAIYLLIGVKEDKIKKWKEKVR